MNYGGCRSGDLRRRELHRFGRSIDDADSPFSLPADNYNLAAERGPARRLIARHRFMSLANLPLHEALPPRHVACAFNRGRRYNITTGRDDNGDTVSNDRPAGVTRNSATRQRADRSRRATELESSRSAGAAAPPAGPQVRIVRGDSADPLGGMGGRRRREQAIRDRAVRAGIQRAESFQRAELQRRLGSPFFGQPTSAAAPRRLRSRCAADVLRRGSRGDIRLKTDDYDLIVYRNSRYSLHSPSSHVLVATNCSRGCAAAADTTALNVWR